MDCKEMILSDDFYDILLDYPASLAEPSLEGIAHCILELEGEYRILYVDSRDALPLSVAQYRYAYIPKCYGLLLPKFSESELTSAQITAAQLSGGAYEESGITAVSRPPLSLSGENILIGFIDTGVRYWLDEFIREDGGSKIFSIWDQTQQTGDPPEGLVYGTEYTQEAIDEALQRRRDGQEDELLHRDSDGHGTGLVSVALRAAPEAQAVMVKCREAKPRLKEFYGISPEAVCFAESDIMAAISYLRQVAERENRPMVLCFALGTNMGDHTGNSLLNRYMEEFGNQKSRCVVIGGGNEGNQAHHYKGELMLDSREQSEFVYEDVEIRVSENARSFSFELWGEVPATFTISLRAPDGELVDRIPIRYGLGRNIRFLFSGTLVYVSYVLVERGSGSELVFVRFSDPSPGIWTVRVFAEGSYGIARYNIWLPMERFLSQPVYFLRPNPYRTMTEPAYSRTAIGHTYFDSENGSFAVDSGRGGENLEQIMPALSVAGVDVSSASGALTGSGTSAALMAGAAALFMEWAILRQGDILLSSVEIRNYFIRGAEREQNVEYPNATWGFGKMNIENVFRGLIEEI